MAGMQLLDTLFSRLAVRSCSACSPRSLLAGGSSSSSSIVQKHGYATQANMLGGLKPVKGARKNVGRLCASGFVTSPS